MLADVTVGLSDSHHSGLSDVIVGEEMSVCGSVVTRSYAFTYLHCPTLPSGRYLYLYIWSADEVQLEVCRLSVKGKQQFFTPGQILPKGIVVASVRPRPPVCP